MKKRFLSTLLTLCAVLMLLPGTALATEIASGTYGANLTWTLDDEGTLTIRSTGEVLNDGDTDRDDNSLAPWYVEGRNEDIRKVIVANGVTSIGDLAFFECTNLTSVSIPKGMTRIGEYVFDGCSKLSNITLPEGMTSIGLHAFAFCESLSSIDIPESLTDIGENAFDSCTSLSSITIPKSVTRIGEFAFYNCPRLADVYYDGNEEQWGQILCYGYSYDSMDDPGTPWQLAFADGGQEYVGDALLNTAIHYSSSGGDSKPVGPASTPASTGTGFQDVPANAYYAAPVAWAVKQGITNGTGSNQFSPNQTCTNAQILTFLWRAYGESEPTIRNPFPDDIPLAFAKAAIWAYENKMISGSTFDVNTPCTRAMAVTYMWLAAGSPTNVASASFTDVPPSANNAQAVAWAVANNITNGTSANQFSPNATCTRAQIVTFLYRLLAA